MTAASPYAPASRNSYLRRSSSTRSSFLQTTTSSSRRGTMIVALFVFVSNFWKDMATRGKWAEKIKESSIINWIAGALSGQALPENSLLGTDREPNDTLDTRTPEKFNSSLHSNLSLIQSVLNYWFGSYSPEEAQKKLWMISNSSVEHRTTVDKEITERFGSLLCQLVQADSKLWQEWCLNGSCNLYGAQGKIAAIIVLDQFSRHVIRYAETNHELLLPEGITDLPTKAQVDAKALETAQLFMKEHQEEIRCGMIPTSYYVFSLMPFRHASTIETLSVVQDSINKQNDMSTQMDALLGRFRRATNRRMAALQDEARRQGSQVVNQNQSKSKASPTETHPAYNDEDILEAFPFEGDMASAAKHPVSKTILQFLEEVGIQKVKAGASDSKKSALITSLSGGVDSMVIASVLSNLKQAHNLNVELIAIHIDYGNRPESAAEADYVRRFCESIHTRYICKRIDEVRRGVTARDEYERIARDLRYGTYRDTIEFAHKELGCTSEVEMGIMLGHHKGDLRENVLSNAHKGCGPLDLSGMTAISKNNGVTIYRPLLPLEKTSVFDYSHLFGVPYFKDTTPEWSTRGKLRNQLLPLIQDVYGDGSLRNLSNLAIESDHCRALLYKSILGPCLDRVERHRMGLVLETKEWRDQTLFFWKFVLREALHSGGLGMFSDKSVQSFLVRIQSEKLREGWLQCRRDYAVYLQKDGKVFIFYPSSFPFLKNEMYHIEDNKVVKYGESQKIGPWIIKGAIVGKRDAKASRVVEKAIPSIDTFMSGRVTYNVSVPSKPSEDGDFVPRPLVLRKFTKVSRPSAWKNNDDSKNFYLKVQETLPMLGNDDTAIKALSQPASSGFVHEKDGSTLPNPIYTVNVTLELADKEVSASETSQSGC